MAAAAAKFEDDLHEVLSSWIAYKETIPKRWKGDVKPIMPMSYSDLQVSGIGGCQRLVSRARKTMRRLTSLSDTLRELSTAIQVEAEAAQQNFEVVSNMCNLIFLPNELLGRIFQFVINGDPSQTTSIRTKAAVSLSHVSQYFRATALACASLWSNISGSADIDLLCLSRSKEALLDVVTEIALLSIDDRDELVLEQSLIDALPHSKRWRSLDIQYVYKHTPGQMPDRSPKLRQAFREVDVRSLVSLRIRNIEKPTKRMFHTDPERMVEDYHEFQHWDAPNLRHLTSTYYFPRSFPSLTNLTSLDVALKPGQISMTNFHQDLSCMTNLEHFTLKLVRGNYQHGGLLESFESVGMVDFRRVRCFKIEMESQWSDRIDIFKPFFSSMSFPNAVDLHIKVCGEVRKMYPEDDEAYLELCTEVDSIIQHDMQFPRVERFRLEAIGSNIGAADDVYTMVAQRGVISLSVPLAFLPNVKHFALSSNGCPNPSGLWDSLAGAPLPVPALETISIQIIKFAAWDVARFVEDLLIKQKDRGEWEEFRELIVKDNNLESGGRTSMKVYGRDNALEWCERRSTISDDVVLID